MSGRRPVDRRAFLQHCGTAFAAGAVGAMLPGRIFAATTVAGEPITGAASRALCALAIDTLQKAGASYGDIRLARYRSQWIGTRDERVEGIHDSESFGFGVRAIAAGSWGFAASSVVTESEVVRVAREAVAIAKASALAKTEDVKLSDEPVHRDVCLTPMVRDPFAIPLDAKLDLLVKVNDVLKKVPAIEVAEGYLVFSRKHQFFASTEGSDIEIDMTRSWGGYTATAVAADDSQERSYEATPMNAGWEHIEESDFLGNAERVAAQAAEKVRAENGPEGVYDLVLDPDHLCLTIHESAGHPSELDRALGWEANYAGTSFLVPDELGKLKYGSKVVNIVADNTRPGSLASTGYDDDGAECQRVDIVREGVFVGFSTSREFAPKIGVKRSGGSCRADSWSSIPLLRIANVGLEPGDAKLDALIGDTKKGIAIEGRGSWSIDQKRYNFQFGGDCFWEIANGRKTRMLKNVLYQGITPEFWGSCDAVCDASHWRPTGVTNCGKGQPGQSGQMTHGASHARFRGVKVIKAKA
ncbi:MAG: TldD/PmbA family protein [Acidobacteriota bacterium]